jgi:elongator complex protein 2
MAMSARDGLSEQVQPLYISAACSRSNSSAARPHDGLVAFASGHLIALWKSAVRTPDYSLQGTQAGLDTLTGCHGYQNELSAGVHNTLPGYKGDVTALDFVQGSGKSRYLVSGDATGAVNVWKEHEEHVSTPPTLFTWTGADTLHAVVSARDFDRTPRLRLGSRRAAAVWR